MGSLETDAVLGQGELSLALSWEWLLGPTTVLGIVGCASLVVAARPVFEACRPSTRRPTERERDELVVDTSGVLDRPRVRIVDRPDSTASRARAAGIVPGARYVFVAERLLEECSTATCRAVLAHEVGHHRTFQPAVQFLGLGGVGLLAWGVATVVSVAALHGTIVLLGAYLVVTAFVERQAEYHADRYAARRVGTDTMCAALDRLAETASSEDGHSLRTWLRAHPSFEARKKRLREQCW